MDSMQVDQKKHHYIFHDSCWALEFNPFRKCSHGNGDSDVGLVSGPTIASFQVQLGASTDFNKMRTMTPRKLHSQLRSTVGQERAFIVAKLKVLGNSECQDSD